MQDYIDSGHMTKIAPSEQRNESSKAHYLPYISISRLDALTTKVRNVFNASAEISNGYCLNDLIHAGPKLQTLIFDVITQCRQFRFS